MGKTRTLTTILMAFFTCLAYQSDFVRAEFFEVLIIGEVEFNQVTSGVLGNVNPGDFVGISLWVDSDNFLDSPNFPTRGYVIEKTMFALDFGGANQLGLQDPFPGGINPYFVLRDNDPAVDGFFLSRNVDVPMGLPLNQTGQFGKFSQNFLVTYDGQTLPSLNIEDAIGHYDLTGLSVFNWTISDGPFDATGFLFNEMLIRRAEKPCQYPVGDLNFDFKVNLLDVAPFVDSIMTGDYICEADTNLDGLVNLQDVAPFVRLLTGS